jgi:CHAD domain-containing protein
MAYQVRRRETVQAAVRRIAMAELRASINDVRSRQPDSHEAVHDFRKRCKKFRGLLRLVRPHLDHHFQHENAFFRDISRELSFVRDAQALLEALDRLLNHYRAEIQPHDLNRIYAHLIDARDRVAGGEDLLIEKLEALVQPLEQAMDRASHWEISADGFDAIEGGLIKTYRRARRAMAQAYEYPSTLSFHEWRKRVKYHWHHSLLLRRICPKLLKPHRRLAELLGELLGQDHDYAVLRERLTDLQEGPELDQQKTILISLIDRRQAELRAAMYPLGRYLQAEKPRQLAARWRVYWDTWRDESPE